MSEKNKNKTESQYPLDWFKKADEDLKAAEVLLDAENLTIAAFHIQQAIEKYLKGFLLSKGWRLRRIHDLEELLDEAISYANEFERFRSLCQTVTEYYSGRYPFIISLDLTREELVEVLSETKELIE